MNNMQTAEQCITFEINKCKELHFRLAKRLSHIAITPVFEKMAYSKKNGRKYYSEVWIEDGKQKSLYLGGEDNSDVKKIKEKHFLKEAIVKLERHISKLENCKYTIEPFNYIEINEKLPKVYQLTPEHLKQVIGPTPEEKWYKKALKEKAEMDAAYGISYETELSHTAKDGTRTRSKSEVAIANEFFGRGKPCIYEMPTHVEPFILHPDFTFYSNRYNKVIMWEHAGMLGDADYMQSFSERTDHYIRAGFLPCVDVIFSFDTMLGDLDSSEIKRLLDEYE